MKWFIAGALMSGLCMAASIEADARRGAQLFNNEKCVTCHSLQGKGGKTAPDLGRRLDRGYDPASLASRMWNHAPAMWSAMKDASIAPPKLDEREAADLFAFFYSVRYFEQPGDAARGKHVFEAKHCSECHALSGSGTGPGKAVAQWTSLTDPVDLIERMWNHSGDMQKAYRERNIKWPELSAQDLTDILVYLQNLPGNREANLTFQMPSGEGGKELLEAKGCRQCHKGKLALEGRLANRTLTDVAASMWDHAPRMADKPVTVTGEEMRKILSYIWSSDFFRSSGDSARGQKFFAAHCNTCHDQIKLPHKEYSAISMVSALWTHGPKMFATMQSKNIAWPKLTPADMSNVVAYLNVKKP